MQKEDTAHWILDDGIFICSKCGMQIRASSKYNSNDGKYMVPKTCPRCDRSMDNPVELS
jgi:ribosomal protein L37AE/L43A